MKKCIIICNKHSGKGMPKETLASFYQHVQDSGFETTVYTTEYHEHALEIVRKMPHVDLLISIGGDGTFNEVVRGLVERKDNITLAHLPHGTTNDVGLMLGLNKDISKSFNTLMKNGVVKNFDICMINNRPFTYVAGCGKFMHIPYETGNIAKRTFGHLAYLFNGIKEFLTRTTLVEMTYTIDGKEYGGLFSLVLISNANRIAGFSNFYNDIKLDDKKMEVLFTNISKKKDFIKTLLLLSQNNLKQASGVYTYRTNEVTIKLKSRFQKKWCIDGEKLDDEENIYHIKVGKSINLLVPKQVVTKLFK